MTKRTLYALLVGIDAYRPPVPALHGCVADVEQVAALLRSRAAAAGDAVEIRFLLDGEANRAAVIEAFRSHLGRAGGGDTALFYYSGHGSQEQARPEHLVLEPDGLNETLVLVDSRDPGRYDLADKELAVLTGEVAAVAGHTLMVLDCCHSGSGVRAAREDGTRVRRAPTDTRDRPLETYLGLDRWSPTPALSGAGASGPGVRGGVLTEADWLGPSPSGGYVLMAACRSHQTAKEITVDGVDRGAFSVALHRALAGIGGEPTYLDLQRWVASAVRNLAADQSPVLEAPRPEDASRPFLGGIAAPALPVLTASFQDRRGWVLDAGRLHGLAPASDDGAARVDLFRLDGVGGVLTAAEVGAIGVASSLLHPDDGGPLDRAATYRAVVTAAGQPWAAVVVHGDGPLADEVREGLLRSPVVHPADGESPDLEVRCGEDLLSVHRPGSERPITEPERVGEAGAAARVVAVCEHVGRWIGIAERANPTSALRADEVTLSVLDEAGDPVTGPDGTVEVWYRHAGSAGDGFGSGPDDADPRPVIKVRVTNSSRRALHCAVLALSELSGVECLTTGGSVLLQPGETMWLTDHEDRPQLRTTVPEGAERTTDLLKLIAGTEPFDAQALNQPDLVPPTVTRGTRAPEGADRGITRVTTTPDSGPDWTTREVLVTTVRPGSWSAPLPASGPGRVLASGVRVLPHSGCSARARLATVSTATRSTLVPLLPPALLAPDALTEPFTFAGTRSVGEEISVLHLVDLTGAATVSRENPLVIRVERPLALGEHVLPVVHDGEDYVPVGHAVADGGATDLVLDLIPPSTAVTRGIVGSLTILFRMLVLKPLGRTDEYPLLSLVDYSGGEPRYVRDPAAVERAVGTEGPVLLLLHGIIGDTRGAAAAVGVGPDPLRDHYRAVLAFDYENINTPVPETAAALAGRLREYGLDSGQRLDVVAHSLGGLVSRWWIERSGGAAAVRSLVTCGTPHAGSPWPSVQDVATALLTLALNQVGPILGPALGFLLRGVEHVDAALDSMTPNSPLLRDLARGPAPDGVRYAAVAGDQPFGVGADTGRVVRLLRKVRLPEMALGMVFGGTDHDIAVSVPRATAMGRGWARPPLVVDADCNHLGYFATPSGLAAVRLGLGV